MANNRKKNMGRVKHYRHSFYSGPQRVRQVLSILLIVVLLFGLGWLIGPHVIDFGTRTWYSMTRGDSSKPAAPDESASVPAAEPTPTPTPAPTPTPTPEPPKVEEGGWAFVSLSSIDTAEKAAATAQQLADEGKRYAVITLKDEQGYIYYPSKVETAAQSVAASTIDAAAAAKAFEEAGLVPVAQLCAFQDPKAPYADRTMGIHYRDTEYFWLDANSEAGGKPWLDPYAPTAIAFIDGLMDEVRSLGYEQILLTGVQYPYTDGSNAGYQNPDGIEKPQQLASLINGWQKKAEEADGVLWVEYSMAQLTGAQAASLGGGTVADLGVEHLVIRLKQDLDPEQQAEQVEQATAALEAANVQHLVLRQGAQASFAE